MARRLRFFLPLLVAALLAACAQQARKEQTVPRPPRDAIAAYSLEGRVSVRRGKEARQANIAWQHGLDRDSIELSGPLGQKAARLTRDVYGARLDTASHETYTAVDWGGLAERVLGVALPLDDIARWVTAAVAANTVVERDAVGRPLSARINGWQIDYLAYESESAEALPALMTLHRDDIDVRMKIDQWQIE